MVTPLITRCRLRHYNDLNLKSKPSQRVASYRTERGRSMPTMLFKDGTDLYATDGTTINTAKLTVNGAATSGQGGLFFGILNPHFTVLGNEVIFQGYNSSENLSLWVTDGTSGGSVELAPSLFVNNTLSNPYFTVVGGNIVFAATYGLWVTNGTSVGTSQIAVMGADPSGLSPTDITGFRGGALFEGIDASFHESIWVTNGTAPGTTELAALEPNNFVPNSIAVFGNEALFAA